LSRGKDILIWIALIPEMYKARHSIKTTFVS